MEMRHEPEMTAEMAIVQLQSDVDVLRRDLDDEVESLKETREFITGNGDPKKGLLWLVSDLTKMVGTMTQLIDTREQGFQMYVADQKKQYEQHIANGHAQRGQMWNWRRLGFDVGRSVATWVLIGFLAFAVAHVHVSIGSVP